MSQIKRGDIYYADLSPVVANPCGKVFTRAELELIADMAEKYDTYVITDEVYEHIVYAPYHRCMTILLPWKRYGGLQELRDWMRR